MDKLSNLVSFYKQTIRSALKREKNGTVSNKTRLNLTYSRLMLSLLGKHENNPEISLLKGNLSFARG